MATHNKKKDSISLSYLLGKVEELGKLTKGEEDRGGVAQNLGGMRVRLNILFRGKKTFRKGAEPPSDNLATQKQLRSLHRTN